MKKTKLFMISALALVMMASFVFGIVAMPVKVSADPEPAQEVENIIYFANEIGWTDVYAYAWGGEVSVEWPGTKLTEKDDDYGYYIFDAADNTCVIFNNNNGQQTHDITITANNVYHTNNWVDGKLSWTGEEYVAKVRVYAHYYGSYEYAYIYNTDADKKTEWPGELMGVDANQGWKVVDVTDYSHIIFNDGNDHQTTDLDITSNLYYYDSDDAFKGWYASIDDLNATINTHDVFFYNDEDWSKVYAYVWTDAGVKEIDWPGNEATQVGESKWYCYTCSLKYTQVIFTNNAGGQTVDHVISEGAYFYNDVWYATEEAATAQINADEAREQLVKDKKAAMAAKGGYFLIGCVREQTEWDFAEVTNSLTTVTNSVDNVAEGWNVTLKAGDKFKIVNAAMTEWHGDTTEINAAGHEVTVNSDGIYNIYLSKDNKVYVENIKVGEEDLTKSIEIKDIKYKVSKTSHGDNKYYLLVVAGIVLDADEDYTGCELGLCINGDVWSSNTYYSAVSLNLGDTDEDGVDNYRVYQPDEIVTGATELIVREIEIDGNAVENLEAIAYIYDTVNKAVVTSFAYGK